MQWVTEKTTLPRMWVLRNPRLWKLFFRAKKPWLELHLKSTPGEHLTKEEYRFALRTYVNEARRKGYEGLFCASWFMDSAVSEISPRLGFLREDAQTFGAKVFSVHRLCKSQMLDATKTSPTRRSAFHHGEYEPKVHCMVLPV